MARAMIALAVDVCPFEWSQKTGGTREAALSSGYISAEEFDTIVVPAHMVGDPHKDLEETRKVVGQ